MQPETMLVELAKRANPDKAPKIAADMAEQGKVAPEAAEAAAEPVIKRKPDIDLPDSTRAVVPEPRMAESAEGVAPPTAAPAVGTATAEPVPPAEPPADNPIYDNISDTYRQLRIGMALLAMAMPLALVIGGGLGTIQTSLSAYYHFDDGAMRDWFVGILWAVGAFLLFYKGYTNRENWALNIGGIAAVCVALFPTACTASICQPGTVLPPNSMVIHGASAVTFFLLIAYVCVFRSGDTLQLMEDEAQKARFTWIYRALGIAMVAMPLTVIAIEFLGGKGGAQSYWIILVEVIGIAVFAVFWLYKSHEIRVLERQHA